MDQPDGTRIEGRVRLKPLAGPMSPGAYDFRRKPWCECIGAAGYSDGRFMPIYWQVEVLIPLSICMDSFRGRLAYRLETILAAPESALVFALITGDRSRILPTITETMRGSGLANLLAVSRLHAGLVMALVFALVRFILATIEPIALRTGIKKWAAALLSPSVIYLLISGATLPTQRAFVSLTMALCAIFRGGEAIPLSLVAMAAFGNLGNTAGKFVVR